MRNSISLLILILVLFACEKKKGLTKSDEAFIASQDALSSQDSLAYVFQTQALQKDATIRSLSNGKKMFLKDLEVSEKVFCYISEIQCSTCVDQELNLIKAHYDADQIVLICNYSSQRDLKLYLRLNKFDLPAYFIESPPSELMLRLANPTFFRLGNDLKPSSVFFASVSTPNKSSQYHTIMAGR